MCLCVHACMFPCLQWQEANLGCYSSDKLGCYSSQASILHFAWNSSFKLYWMVKSSRDTPVSTCPVLVNKYTPLYLDIYIGYEGQTCIITNLTIETSSQPHHCLSVLAYGFVCLLCHVTAQLTSQARGAPDLLVIMTHGSWKTFS